MSKLNKKLPIQSHPADRIVDSDLDFAKEITIGKISSGYIVKVYVDDEEGDLKSGMFMLKASAAARSLIFVALEHNGLTRLESMKYCILSLSQHVSVIRDVCSQEIIITQRIPPKNYARYHLANHVTIQLVKTEEEE